MPSPAPNLSYIIKWFWKIVCIRNSDVMRPLTPIMLVNMSTNISVDVSIIEVGRGQGTCFVQQLSFSPPGGRPDQVISFAPYISHLPFSRFVLLTALVEGVVSSVR